MLSEPTILTVTLDRSGCLLGDSLTNLTNLSAASATVMRQRVESAAAGGAGGAAPTPLMPPGGQGGQAEQRQQRGLKDQMWKLVERDQVREQLVDLLHVGMGSRLAQLAALFMRLDDLSHVLAWARLGAGAVPPRPESGGGVDPLARGAGGRDGGGAHEAVLSLVELPRLRLSFEVRRVGEDVRLYCREHAGQYLSPRHMPALEPLLHGLPHAVALQGDDGDNALLVSAAAKPLLTADSRTLLLRGDTEWLANLPQARHYLYPVHSSGTHLCSPTLSSSLYLLLLYFLHGMFADVIRILESCMSDTELSPEEAQLWRSLRQTEQHDSPDAHAARLHLFQLWGALYQAGREPPPSPPSPLRQEAVAAAGPSDISGRSEGTLQEAAPTAQRIEPPWQAKIARYVAGYVLRRSQVSASCRLSTEEEMRLLTYCLGDDEQRRELGLLEPLLREHLLVLTAAIALDARHERGVDDTELVLPARLPSAPRPGLTARWFDVVVRPDQLAFCSEGDARLQEARILKYTPPLSNYGEGALYELLDTLESLSLDKHFLLLYELLTGVVKWRIFATDQSEVIAALLLRSLPPADWADPAAPTGPMIALLRLITARQQGWLAGAEGGFQMAQRLGILPTYETVRKEMAEEQEESSGVSMSHIVKNVVDVARDVFTGDLMTIDAAGRRLFEQAHSVAHEQLLGQESPVPTLTDAGWYEGDDDGERVVRVAGWRRSLVCWRRSLVCSRTQDLACGERSLHATPAHGPLSAELLHAMSGEPLEPISLAKFVVPDGKPDAHAADHRAQAPATKLSDMFDISVHPQARSYVAQQMLERLDKDVQYYAAEYASRGDGQTQLAGMQPADIRACIEEARAKAGNAMRAGNLALKAKALLMPVSRIEPALTKLGALIDQLTKLRQDDAAAVAQGLEGIRGIAHDVDTETASRGEMELMLRRLCGQEAVLSFPLLTAQLLSSAGKRDLLGLCPHLTEDSIEQLMQLAAATLLRSARYAYVAGCCAQATALQAELASLRGRVVQLEEQRAAGDLAQPAFETELRAAGLELSVKASSLAAALSVKRHTVRKAEGGEYAYDPRFAVFEFTANVLLRAGQVKLVKECVTKVNSGGSLVSQMIMGAGKTSTILPLLALFLANGQQLMMQVVPMPLLAFTRALMRERFSSVITKPVYTFAFERASSVDVDLVRKLEEAVKRSAVVVSNPAALKSFALRFIEKMHDLDYMSRAEPAVRSGGFGKAIAQVSNFLKAAVRVQRKATIEDLHLEVRKQRQQAELCAQVLAILQRGVLVLDEVDLVLHPLRSELNWPLGGKVPLDLTDEKDTPGLRWTLAFHGLDPFFFATGGSCVMEVRRTSNAEQLLVALRDEVQRGRENKSLQLVPHLVLLDRKFYREKLRPILSNWMLLLLFHLRLRVLTWDEATRFLNDGELRQDKLRALQTDGGTALKLLNLTRELLDSIIPFVLSKVDRVAFGLLSQAQLYASHVPRKRRLLAVPFVGKDTPSRASEFSHPDVVISLTTLAYRYEGLRETDFLVVLRQLKKDMAQQFGAYHTRPACRTFVEWIEGAGAHVRGEKGNGRRGSDADGTSSLAAAVLAEAGADEEMVDVWPLHLVDLGDEEQVGVLYKLLRQQPQVVRHYLYEHVFPSTMKFQQMKLSACGQELGATSSLAAGSASRGRRRTCCPRSSRRATTPRGTTRRCCTRSPRPRLCTRRCSRTTGACAACCSWWPTGSLGYTRSSTRARSSQA